MKKIVLKIIYKTLAIYARRVIANHKPFVIAITGSVGKSSTKEAVYQVMKDYFHGDVWATPGNLNAEIGIPLTILGYNKQPSNYSWPCFLVFAFFRSFIKKYPKFLILEMGVEHKGDLNYFSTIVRPDLSIITGITPMHVVNFKSLNDLIAEKLSMITITKDGGKVLVNSDNQYLKNIKTEKNLETIGITTKKADFVAEDIAVSSTGTEFRIVTTGRKIAIKSPLLGEHLVYSSLFAFAVGQNFGIQSLQIKESLEKLKPIPGRMNLIPGKNGITIIDDTYNANLLSIQGALDTLYSFNSKNRKVLILGNINELGEYEQEIHKEAAIYAKDKCDLAIFIGKNAKMMSANCRTNSLAYYNKSEFMRDMHKILIQNDIVLIKASQNGNFFEEITKDLMKNPTLAGKMLVRQSRYWLNKKHNK